MWEAGYLPEAEDERPSPDVLFAAMAEEAAGKPRYVNEDRVAEHYHATLDGLAEAIDALDLDVRTTDNATLKQALKGGRYWQGEKPVVTLQGDELAPAGVDIKTLRAAVKAYYRSVLKTQPVG